MLAWLSDLNWWGAFGGVVGGGVAIAVVNHEKNVSRFGSAHKSTESDPTVHCIVRPCFQTETLPEDGLAYEVAASLKAEAEEGNVQSLRNLPMLNAQSD